MTWQNQLLAWYRRNKRDLPWRRSKDPYRIWISEIMLQQTTVEAVIPYYHRFLARFPTIKKLAGSSEEDVLKLWSGLGYYSRARNLRKAAQMICGGGLPDTVEELIRLPGIGRYTAGAIASIAFERRAPIVDGNVIRVLSRLFRMDEDPKTSGGRAAFWAKAEEILPGKNLGDFNQSLMELGATVCHPENPLCPLCPIASKCLAYKAGEAAAFPKAKQKAVYRDVLMTAAVVQKGGDVLVLQRSSEGLLKGLWEVPMVEGGIESLIQAWPLDIIRPLSEVRHSVLNRRLKILPILCRIRGRHRFSRPHRWISPANFEDLPTSSMNRKILRQLETP